MNAEALEYSMALGADDASAAQTGSPASKKEAKEKPSPKG